MNVPNMLTVSRFILIPIFLALYFNDYRITALLVVLLAGLTDFLDGYIARRRGQITMTGIMLDPLADKLMMLSVVIALLLGHMLPWSAVAVMAFREVGMIAFSAFFHFRGYKTVPANLLGKATTVVYYLAVVLLFLEQPGGVAVLWSGIALSFIASAIYLSKFRRLNSPDA
ncbi:CDP-diacylglycerol--glycerol-3-phosphate 3-phosphatidyltransferase [Cohnella kolymensis]|uniref:Phosphatidylglycerophosphate synthase n=1 Tax=Cohnella kolymensis TaxID=1590652 RepID=A0ABR5A6X1_9BACL|nr:CDP-alcohol phosphatidyltransferase family protein [Cohnella kolymensis]KIL36667.1 CDP-diacylglycerol--glycerol-3-phosphate 3-phosphatidyltransferase [Cohnella kolymensis]